jgi:hypothetical protein
MMAIPPELQLLGRRWILWDVAQTPNGKPTKRPHGSTLDPSIGMTLKEAVEADAKREDGGIGLVVTGGIDVTVPGGTARLIPFDMDGCRCPITGALIKWAEEMVAYFKHSFTEITPSGAGLRLWLLVRDPPKGIPKIRVPFPAPPGVAKKPEIQTFGCGPAGFVAFTGDQLPSTKEEITIVDNLDEWMDKWKVGEVDAAVCSTLLEELLPNRAGDEGPTMDEIAKRVDPLLVDGEWEKVGVDSASECWWRLVREVLHATKHHAPSAVEFLLTETAFGTGLVDSRDPDRYTRRDWVVKDVARIVVKASETSAASTFDDGFDVAGWEPPPAKPSPIAKAWGRSGGASWFDKRPPDRRYLLKHPNGDGLLPLGKAGTLSSAGGVGKTNAIVQLAVSVAAGRPWLGHFHVDEDAPRRVLLLLGEEDASEVHRRIHYAGEALDLNADEREAVSEHVVALPLAGEVCPLLKLGQHDTVQPTEHLDALREQLRRHAGEGWGLIVLDPQSRFAGVEVESNNALATRFVQECEALTRSPGNPTVLVVAHSSKLARREGKADSRGVTALTDGFRWHAMLVSKGKDAATLAVEKNNYGRPSDDVHLVRREGGGGLLFVENDTERGQREAAVETALDVKERRKDDRAANQIEKLIGRVVACAGETPGLSKGQLAGVAVGNRAKLLGAIDAAVGRGLLENRPDGGAHHYYAVAESAGELLG